MPHRAHRGLRRYAWLSILAAILTIGLKYGAYRLTGSIGLLSDAAESLVNLAAAIVALIMISVASKPADAKHPFGHGKAEYFASGFEGALILMTAVGIAWAAFDRYQHPIEVQAIDLGVRLSFLAAILNLGVALILLRVGRRYGSIALEADGKHLMSDVWTTVAIASALIAMYYTGLAWIDPVVAALAAIQIVWSGTTLIVRSISGLLDTAVPNAELKQIQGILDEYRGEGVEFHDLRTRAAGVYRFITVHVLVPGEWTVQRGHDLSEELEADIRTAIPHAVILTHLEPVEDEASFDHETL